MLYIIMKRSGTPAIPTNLTEIQFNEFILPIIPLGSRGPQKQISSYKAFSYICRVLHTGMQWKELEIRRDDKGKPEIHYTNIYRTYQRWSELGVFELIFARSVQYLHDKNQLNTSILHGDGTCTAGKKGGENVAYNGHKKHRGDKVITVCDRDCNIVSPLVSAPGNRHENPLFPTVLQSLKGLMKSIGVSLAGTIMSLDGAYDAKKTRKMIFNSNMTPNINENKRGRKKSKRGRKKLFDRHIWQERFRTIERVFAWEDKFKRVLIRFERIDQLHYSFKNLAYALINFRHLATV